MQTLQQLKAGELRGATKLKLACGLETFPEEIFSLAETLEYLDLSGNKLQALPPDFGRLVNLKIAFFSDNLFTEYPAVLSECLQLEMVGFKANKIARIPENAFSENLRWLILTDNLIPEIPASIGNCERLQKLMLAGNKLRTLPPEMQACKHLELLRISANEINELPAWLLNLPHLSWLAFAGNPCSKAEIPPVNLPEIAWEDLTLTHQLGEGASGVISQATLQLTGENSKEIAVKIFKGHVTSDGLPADEMNACLAAGKHTNLVPVLGKIKVHPEEKSGLILELIPPEFKNLGGPPNFTTCTRDTFPEGTTFSITEIIKIASGIASAAAHLHAHGIMHGDLYAHNILVNEEATCFLSDFGAATFIDQQPPQNRLLLERLEVRAFGYLLDDLLNHLKFSNQDPRVEKLYALKLKCLLDNVSNRPDFDFIVADLQAF